MMAKPIVTASTIIGSERVPTISQNGTAKTAIAIPPPIMSGLRPTRSDSQPPNGTPTTEIADATVIAMTAVLAGSFNCWLV